jgi:hypothetical protein
LLIDWARQSRRDEANRVAADDTDAVLRDYDITIQKINK